MGKKRFHGLDSDLSEALVGFARVVAAGNVDISPLNNADDEDGITLATNDLILLPNQDDKTKNGLYIVGASEGETDRHPSFNDDPHFFPGATWRILEGSIYARSTWTVASPAPIVVGTDDIKIIRISPEQKDTVAGDIELKAITIPVNTGNGTDLETLKGAQSYDDRILGWRIIENDGAFQYAMANDMASPAPTRDEELGWAPPLSAYPLGRVYLRSTSTSTVAAILELYLARGDI